MAKNQRITPKEGSENQALAPETKDEIMEDSNPIAAPKRLHSNKYVRLLAVFMLLFSVYLFIAFLSYCFSWWKDFDLLTSMNALTVWTNYGAEVSNITGRLGAFLAHAFIYKGFGIPAFLLLAIFINWGLFFLGIKWKHLIKFSFIFLFITIWSSVLFGLIFRSGMWSIVGGTFGFQSARFLIQILGFPGTALVLFFTFIAFLVIAYNFHIPSPAKKVKKVDNLQNTTAAAESLPETEETTGTENGKETPTNTGASFVIEARENHSAPIAETESIESFTSEPEDEFTENEEDDNESFHTTLSEQLKDNTGVDFVINPTTEENPILPEDEYKNDSAEEKEPERYGIDTPYDPRLDLRDYKFPGLDLLQDYGDKNPNQTVQSEELLANKHKIEETLKNFGIQISQIKATIGPTVTLYEIVPAPGVKISKIKNLEDDIALSLSALGIRIIAPIPGKGTIGIEVPNQTKQTVSMKTMLTSDKFVNTSFDLPIAFGKTISNECFITDLAKMPHLLMAGATGQGKSVGLNAVIASLLYKKHPSELKFVLVDPKKVELTLFNKIERHFLAKLPDAEDAIITDTRKVVRTLNSLCKEMDERYDLLKDAQVKGIKEYNQKFTARKLNPNDGHRFLPYIVLIIDEFADLIMTAGKEVELPIARLAQLARAIGIHLVIATQRPSVNIITGIIKANFPARLAFRVTSKIDSRTILDAGGADQLIGRGDMLLSTGNELIRLQCAFIDTPEIENITDFIGSQRAYPSAFLLPEMQDEGIESSGKSIDINERDEMFEEAAHLIVSTQQGSTSLIQRKLKLGYNRAGRLIDQLEAAGIVGPFEGSKAREVKIKDLVALEEILSNKNNYSD